MEKPEREELSRLLDGHGCDLEPRLRRRLLEACREAEQAMRATTQRFRAVTDLVPDLLWEADASGQMLWHNRRWIEYTGQTAEQALGLGWIDTIHPEDVAGALAAFDESVKNQQSLRHEHRMRRGSDGAYRWFLVQGYPLRDENGAILSWVGSSTDVHEQRIALDLAHEREEQLRLVVEGARDFAIFMMDARGCIATWNIGAERLLGFSEAEAIGQDGSIIFTQEDRESGMYARELAEAQRTGKAIDERWHIRKDQSCFWASGVLHALRDENGNARGFVKVLRDETTRKRRDDAVQEARETAEAASRMKDEFLAVLSHELRTPLSAVLLWVKMLQTPAVNPALMTEGLAAIQASAEAQKELVEDLLDTSRIASGKLRLHLARVDLPVVVGDAVDAILPTATAKGMVVRSDLDGDAGVVMADRERLQQVVWNLLNNAVKFTPAGGRIDVGLWRREDGIEIRVSDTGQGIAPSFLPHVFDAFRQGDASSIRRHGGLGLGLAICRQLVELHGGTVRAESSGTGNGATFTVKLPLPQLGKSLEQDPAPTGDSALPRLDGISILLVEDEAATRNALITLLSRAGADVTAVESASAAIEAFQYSRPDVLLSDIGLPDSDGYGLLRQIREIESAVGTIPLPAVALTAFAREEDRLRSMHAGFVDYLSKPVEPEDLLSVLRSIVPRGS